MPDASEGSGPRAPGVYIQGIGSGLRTVQAAGTSTAAFLGFTPQDGAHEPDSYAPRLVRSWKEYTDCFATTQKGTSLFEELGEPVRHGEDAVLGQGLALSEAVRGFFVNGGSSCYIVPLHTDDDGFSSFVAALEGDAADETGLRGLEKVSEVAMVICPDLASMATTDQELAEGAQKIAAHCAKMQNRVAILDTRHDPSGTPMDRAPELVADERHQQFAALYYPWVTVPGADGTPRTVPPSGHIAGVWARVDHYRGVHKAPANEALQGVTGPSVPLTDDEQGPLNEQGVNCLRVFPDRGTMVWGARTLAADDSDWKYLNARRLVCFLSDSIKQSTTWAVFEPNDERLWSSLRAAVTSFLQDQWRLGALRGATPSEAFFVTCDSSNNSKDAGFAQCDMGVAPVRPGEFICFTVQQALGSGA
ncbi:phage tail sheath subtilisin-like domain-containing protein [Streptomyces sp. XD-27]|uniref:phage tail sheath family protein n=1 Tax=Streptomyces sp. XD-27 TaxID=3062779 RepID=UPI0026F42080|nr:phage tail sheath subtilisin-like domain-containing protein [Streptomyces sp. XD-27]WKX71082.1 phage tail sheath subtilisin-like domain-containing protein [Streptomyces sp. XD-27]